MNVDNTNTIGKIFFSSMKFLGMLLAINIVVYAQQPEFNWVRQGGGIGRDSGMDICRDLDDNSIVVGEFTDNATFSGTTLQSSGDADIFIAKYSKSGVLLWAKKAGGSGKDSPGGGVIVDNSGNIFVVGYFTGSAVFGSIFLDSYGSNDRDMFVAKYNSSGEILWAKRAGGTSNDWGTGMKQDSNGDIIISGYFAGTAYFGNYSIVAIGSTDIFLAKYDNFGNVLWVKNAGSGKLNFRENLLTEAGANSSKAIVLSGYFSGTIVIGSETLNSLGGKDLFVAQFNGAGDLNWVKRAGGVGDDVAYDNYMDRHSNIYITGYFSNTAYFDNILLQSSGGKDIYIAKYDSSGNLIWAKKAGGVDGDEGMSIILDPRANIVVSGKFRSTSYFGGLSVTSSGDADIFVASYNSTGSGLWVQSAGGLGYDVAYEVDTDQLGNCYLTGRFDGTAYFGSKSVSSLGKQDFFIAKLEYQNDELNLIINQIDPHAFPLIKCYVTVTDQAMQPIIGLDESNFTVREKNAAQYPITVTPQGGSSIVNVAFAMDYSGSMSSIAISDMETAVHNFVNLMANNDQGAIFKFAADVIKYQGFTNSRTLLNNAIDAYFSGNTGSTKLYDAIINCVSESISEQGRKAVIVLTDGKNNDGTTDIDVPINHAQDHNIPIFTIGLGSGVDSSVLQQIANETGGQYYYAPNSSDLQAIYEQIANILANQYLVTYSTQNTNRDCQWREVSIEANYLSAVGHDTTRYQSPCDTNSVDLWIDRNCEGVSGESVVVPVHCTDLSSKNVYSVGLTLSYDSSVLQALDVDVSSTLIEGWAAPEIQISNGVIQIGMAGTTPLSGSGDLLKVRFNVAGSVGDSTELAFSNVLLNEGNPVAHTSNGLFKVIADKFSISGRIGYYSDFTSKDVNNADVNLSGGMNLSVKTGSDGTFQFDNLPSDNYTIIPQKDLAIGNSISAYDASLILQAYVGIITINPYQKIASDVSGNGSISPYDASYILRYAVGLISGFPVGANWIFIPENFVIDETNWNNAPTSISYSPLNSDQPNQNFKGIIYGDVSGNWSATNLLSNNGNVSITIRNSRLDGEGRLIVPINFGFTGEISSGSFDIMLNNPKLKFVSYIVSQKDLESFLLEVNHKTEEVTCAFASAQSLSDKNVEVEFIFSAKSAQTINDGDLSFSNFVLDDMSLIATSVSIAHEPNIPGRWYLGQNYPNPFNSSCVFEYHVPEKSRVTIAIYNLMGQKIKTLVNAEISAGIHKISWDGLDNSGRKVGSGIYIYKMKTKKFSELKKMLLVQ